MITRVTLVAGGRAHAREAAIVQRLQPGVPSAVILEGLPDGSGALVPDAIRDDLLVARIAPGCLCCTGNLTLRVTLNRMLRKRPQQIYIGVADASHLSSLQQFLSAAPYDQLLQLAPLVDCNMPSPQ